MPGTGLPTVSRSQCLSMVSEDSTGEGANALHTPCCSWERLFLHPLTPCSSSQVRNINDNFRITKMSQCHIKERKFGSSLRWVKSEFSSSSCAFCPLDLWFLVYLMCESDLSHLPVSLKKIFALYLLNSAESIIWGGMRDTSWKSSTEFYI